MQNHGDLVQMTGTLELGPILLDQRLRGLKTTGELHTLDCKRQLLLIQCGKELVKGDLPFAGFNFLDEGWN